MMRKALGALLAVTMLTPAPTVGAHPQKEDAVLPRMRERRQYQLSNAFVERLAWCETHGDWRNGGYFAGGLGIAQSTWAGYGGHQFAKSPDKATKQEQIIVANRIALWGWTTDGYRTFADRQAGRRAFRYPVGIWGWGGANCALPLTLVKRRVSDAWAFSRFEVGNPYAQTA